MAYHITELEINGVMLTVIIEAPGAAAVKVTFETKQKPFTVHSLGKSLKSEMFKYTDKPFWEPK